MVGYLVVKMAEKKGFLMEYRLDVIMVSTLGMWMVSEMVLDTVGRTGNKWGEWMVD